MALMSLIAIVLFCAVSLEPCFTVWRSSRLEFKGNVDGTDVDGGKTRDLDWAEWIDSNHPVTIDGNPSDWSSYTPHPIGTGSNVVNVYIANDNSHLSICIDAVSDVTDNEQTGDKIQGFIDGDNDNTAPTWISESEANMNSRDNWFTLCGDRDKASDDTDAYNDAGLINKRNNGDTVLWYNQGTWIDEWGYQWATGFNGQPAHMVYEIKIPFSKWSWNPGDPIGIAFEAAKAQGGGSSLIGKYPGGFSINNMGSFRDIRLATQNDRPYYSNPKANPSTISNDGVNETLLTVEAMDSDGSVSSVQIDLTSIGGGSSVNMMDDGNNGDQTAGDDIYSYRTTVSTTALAETKELDFVIFDDHTPNVGSARGEIRLTVIQANRPPEIAPSPTQRITLLEDQDEAYLELRDNVFSDPDYPDDVLTYLMKTNTSWESQCTTPLATYRILMNDSIKVEPLPDRHGTETVLCRCALLPDGGDTAHQRSPAHHHRQRVGDTFRPGQSGCMGGPVDRIQLLRHRYRRGRSGILAEHLRSIRQVQEEHRLCVLRGERDVQDRAEELPCGRVRSQADSGGRQRWRGRYRRLPEGDQY